MLSTHRSLDDNHRHFSPLGFLPYTTAIFYVRIFAISGAKVVTVCFAKYQVEIKIASIL